MVKTKRLFGFFIAILLLLTVKPVDGYLLNSIHYTTLSNEEISYATFEGQLLFVEAFSTTCGFCKAEHDELTQLYQEFGSKIIMLSVSINPGDDIASVIEYTNDYPTTWLIGLDTRLEFANEFNIGNTPTMILFNQEGRLIQKKTGFTEYSELRSIVGQALEIGTPQPSDSTKLGNSNGDSGSLIEDLFESNLFRITFFSILVIMVYVKVSGPKAAT